MRTPPPITDLFQNGQNSGPKINIPDTNIPQQDDCFVYTQADAQASRVHQPPLQIHFNLLISAGNSKN